MMGDKKVAQHLDMDPGMLIEVTSSIVASYVGNNPVPANDLPKLIQSVHQSIIDVASEDAVEDPEVLVPAVPVKRSISPDYIICLEDGKKFKSLKRHLRSKYDMSPDEYRSKWGLRPDYPMVAPNYAKQRSELAKKMGLGQSRK